MNSENLLFYGDFSNFEKMYLIENNVVIQKKFLIKQFFN